MVDAAVAESLRRAGRWIACRAGCSECCHAAFPITMEDSRRLREGLALAPAAAAEGMSRRAAVYRARIRDVFPGEWSTGLLTASDEWREWFFERQKGIACPVLDPESGECLLYEHRPVACRIYGHLIQIGGSPQTRCRLCFDGATEAQMEAARLTVADDAAGDAVEALGSGHTIVALAVS